MAPENREYRSSKVLRRGLALSMVFLDGTTIRAHHKAAGAVKKGDTEDASGIVRRLAAHVEVLVRGPA